jgi:hypothetical protein
MRPRDESYWDCPVCHARRLLEIPGCADCNDMLSADRACAGCGLALWVDPSLHTVRSSAVPYAA